MLTYKPIPRKEIDKHCKQYCENYATCSKTRKQCKRMIGWKIESKTTVMLSDYDSWYINNKMRYDRFKEPRNTFINTLGR